MNGYLRICVVILTMGTSSISFASASVTDAAETDGYKSIAARYDALLKTVSMEQEELNGKLNSLEVERKKSTEEAVKELRDAISKLRSQEHESRELINKEIEEQTRDLQAFLESKKPIAEEQTKALREEIQKVETKRGEDLKKYTDEKARASRGPYARYYQDHDGGFQIHLLANSQINELNEKIAAIENEVYKDVDGRDIRVKIREISDKVKSSYAEKLRDIEARISKNSGDLHVRPWKIDEEFGLQREQLCDEIRKKETKLEILKEQRYVELQDYRNKLKAGSAHA